MAMLHQNREIIELLFSRESTILNYILTYTSRVYSPPT